MSPTGQIDSRVIASAACLGPWGVSAGELLDWCARGSRDEVWTAPSIPGFIESRFNPLVHAAVKQCFALDGAIAVPGTAIVLGSLWGDTTTADVASQNVVRGHVHNPLLFYQSVPTSILGLLSKEFGITGPLSCINSDNLGRELLEMAELLLEDEALCQVLVVGVELAFNPRTARLHELRAAGGGGGAGESADIAVGLLLRRTAGPRPGAGEVALRDLQRHAEDPGKVLPLKRFHNWSCVKELVALCIGYERQRADRRMGGNDAD